MCESHKGAEPSYDIARNETQGWISRRVQIKVGDRKAMTEATQTARRIARADDTAGRDLKNNELDRQG